MAAIAKDGLLNKLPIIVILGATGTGKSKLALEVAKQFNGEIISADAMQVYKGLDIVTNKVTKEEQKEVPHHMIDYLGPGEPIKVVDFRDKALRVIDDLQQRRKVPVIAGGTYYYVESLLWNFLMDASPPPQKRPRLDVSGLGNLSYLIADTMDNVMVDPVEKLAAGDKEKLHQALQSVDPARANELHPNNVRKVIRGFCVLQSHEVKLSLGHKNWVAYKDKFSGNLDAPP
ncbi:tRNA dimethylallyltransferase-like [Macrosteles quadrilineatus]|uniref:tRNA dimethylallyltransferase-like n=1 Tax=Macrosteles quadrilineatus TaxID=74068 RepID=UPI0023E31BA6|nr:tRNA dimethylallyltransferase-like [Macrosteles quadrilineatus]